MKDKFIFVYTTVRSKGQAQKIAQILLKKRHIACANIFPITSLYWWQGKKTRAKEFGIFLKTRAKKYRDIERELKKIHPYQLPCILSWVINKGEKGFLGWIEEEVR